MNYELIHDSTELRTLIAENPDLPIAVLAGEESSSPEYCWTYCADVQCCIAEILDTKTPYDHEDGTLFTDEDDFWDCIANNFCDVYYDLPDVAFDAKVEAEIEKYKPYWRKVIAIYATN